MKMKRSFALLLTTILVMTPCLWAQDIAQNIAVEADTSGAPPDFVAVDVQPKIVQLPNPEYPKAAIEKKIEGRVIVKLWVDEKGRTKKAVIVESDNEIFNKPSIDAAEKARFTPAMAKGKPVDVWVLIPFTFKLKEESGASTGHLWSVFAFSVDSMMIGQCRNVADAAANLRRDFRMFSRDSLAGWTPKDSDEYNGAILVYHAIPICEEMLREAQRSISEAQKYLEQAKVVFQKRGKEWQKVK